MDDDAKAPTLNDIGLELYAANDYKIRPKSHKYISTKLIVKLPAGMCGRIVPSDRFSINSSIVNSQIIGDGEIIILIQNLSSSKSLIVHRHRPIAQLICERYHVPKRIIRMLEPTD